MAVTNTLGRSGLLVAARFAAQPYSVWLAKRGDLVVAFILVVLGQYQGLAFWLEDQSVYFAGAYRWFLGHQIFQDYYSPLGPVSFIIPGLMFVLAGPTFNSLIIADALIDTAIILLCHLILLRFGVHLIVRLFVLLQLGLTQTITMKYPWYNSTSLMLCLLALYLLIEASRHEGLRQFIFIVGCAIAAVSAFWSKQDYGILTLVGMTGLFPVLLFIFKTKPRFNWKMQLLLPSCFLFIAICALLAVFLIVIVRHNYERFFYSFYLLQPHQLSYTSGNFWKLFLEDLNRCFSLIWTLSIQPDIFRPKEKIRFVITLASLASLISALAFAGVIACRGISYLRSRADLAALLLVAVYLSGAAWVVSITSSSPGTAMFGVPFVAAFFMSWIADEVLFWRRPDLEAHRFGYALSATFVLASWVGLFLFVNWAFYEVSSKLDIGRMISARISVMLDEFKGQLSIGRREGEIELGLAKAIFSDRPMRADTNGLPAFGKFYLGAKQIVGFHEIKSLVTHLRTHSYFDKYDCPFLNTTYWAPLTVEVGEAECRDLPLFWVYGTTFFERDSRDIQRMIREKRFRMILFKEWPEENYRFLGKELFNTIMDHATFVLVFPGNESSYKDSAMPPKVALFGDDLHIDDFLQMLRTPQTESLARRKSPRE